MRDKESSPMRRITGMANWVLPKHSGLFDLEFDRYQSLRASFGPAMADPLILVVTLLQIAAYGFFFHSLLYLPIAACNGLGEPLARFVLAGVGVQFLWAIKAVYIFDKAELTDSTALHAAYRVIRTTLFTLPFSFAPAWVIGCLAWPVLRIGLQSGFRFYDQSLLIGQYVQISLWYVGAGQGDVKGNFQSFSDVTISSRSRYWDAASEGMVMNVVGMILLACVFAVIHLTGFADDRSFTVLAWPMSGMEFVALLYLASVGVLLSITNTCSMAATSILEYSRNMKSAPVEADLPADARSKWLTFLPHAIVGIVVYAMLLWLLVGSQKVLCTPVPQPQQKVLIR